MNSNDHSEVMYRLDRNERDIGELTKLVSTTSETVHVFAEGMRHFKDAFAAHEEKCKDETLKLNTLWDGRNKSGGRWDVVSTIAATICGSGGIYAIIELVNHLMK
jgi:predicted class III extradiol MEMO1 family dioxygenase